jgi:hypothetical protein
MRHTNDGGLRLALERLKWALTVPLRHNDDDWHGRLGRALAFLHTAWDDHSALTNSEFAQVFDPSLLPFTPLSQRFGEFRDEHRALTDQLAVLENQVEESGRVDMICRAARQLLAAMERHLAAERTLAWEETLEPSLFE